MKNNVIQKKNGIVVVSAIFVDIKGFPQDIYVPDGRNAGYIEYIHGGVARNVVEDIANLGLNSTTSTSSSSNSTVPAAVATAAISLQKGDTSDWITVTTSSGTSLYKVYVKETDSSKIFNAKNDAVANQALYAILNSDSSLSYKILKSYAKKLDIKFNDKSTKKKFDSYVETTYGGDQV